MAEPQIRAWLTARALAQLSHYGHLVPQIRWDSDGQEASGTCSRCGDGVLIYYNPQPDLCSIEGTAFDSPCPGGTCEHGWRILRRASGVVLQCAHCGAERSEADHPALDHPLE